VAFFPFYGAFEAGTAAQVLVDLTGGRGLSGGDDGGCPWI
jgi:hypothetical protein